jgi:hypothetical protein
VTCWGEGQCCILALYWPCTDRDPWPALFDADPQVAGEEEGGAEVELAQRPGRLRQEVTCWGVGRCGILARY